MANEMLILVLENDPAVCFALGRVSLGSELKLQFHDPADWQNVKAGYALIICNDILITGVEDKLPVAVLKERLNCPLILMTSTGNRRIEGYAREVGAASVLFKPFGAGELRRQVGKLLGGADVQPDSQAVLESGPSGAGNHIYRPVEYGGRIAGDKVFDTLFVELEKRQPLEEGLDAFDVVERHMVKRALLTCDGNQSRAARFLGITRNTLRKRIKKYGFAALLAGDETVDTEDE